MSKESGAILLKSFEKYNEKQQDSLSRQGYLYIYTDKSGLKYLCTVEMYIKLKKNIQEIDYGKEEA